NRASQRRQDSSTHSASLRACLLGMTVSWKHVGHFSLDAPLSNRGDDRRQLSASPVCQGGSTSLSGLVPTHYTHRGGRNAPRARSGCADDGEIEDFLEVAAGFVVGDDIETFAGALDIRSGDLFGAGKRIGDAD